MIFLYLSRLILTGWGKPARGAGDDVDAGDVGASLCDVLEAGVRDVVSLAQVGAFLREVLQAKQM